MNITTRREAAHQGAPSGPRPRSRLLRTAGVAAGVACIVAAVPAVAAAAIVYQPSANPPGRIIVAGDLGGSPRTLAARGTGPVVSPDGATVAYQVQSGPQQGRLRFVNVASGAVVSSPQECVGLVEWSPDSTRVLCETESATSGGIVTGNGLVVVTAATGTPRTLIPARGTSVETYAWSPDSSRIAYSRGRFASQTTDVFVADPSDMTTARRLIRNAAAPVWGPAKIAVTRYTPIRVVLQGRRVSSTRSQVWTVNPSGGGAHQLTHFRTGQLLITGPYASIWTPAGDRIVGTIGGTDVSQLIVIDARTGAIRRLGVDDAVPDAVSTDGRTLLFSSGFLAADTRTSTMSLAGRPGRLVVKGALAVSATADWAP